jgi:hypothetical protein
MTMDEYNTNRRNRLASTGLKLIEAESLADYEAEINKTPEEQTEDEKAAFIEGRALHCLTLEGAVEYESRYHIGGPVNPKTGKEYGVTSQKFKDALAACKKETNKDLITNDVHKRCMAMRKAIHAHPVAAKLISKGSPEVTVFFDLHGVACQIRLDFLSEVGGIVELKSCESLKDFQRTIHWKYGYMPACGLYISGAKAVTPDLPELPYTFIAVEKKGIHKVGVFNVPGDVVQYYQQKNEEHLVGLAEAQRTGFYPTGFEDVRSIEMSGVEEMSF